MKTIIFVLATVVLFSGCGLHEFSATDGILQVEMNKEVSKKACYEAMALSAPDYSKLSDMAIVMIEQQKATAQLVGALTGKSVDPCGGGTNLNDVLISDSRERNESLRSVSGSAAGVIKFGLGVWGATEVVDSVGKNAGNTNVQNGDGSISNTKTSTETNMDVSNTGEEGTATAGGGASEPAFTTDPVVADPIVVTEE